MKTRRAFTLIEMLVVIAIIAIVAALVVNMSALAKAKQREAQVNAGKRSLMLMIEDYHATLNFYPPDNGLLVSNSANSFYDGFAATNPLIYELTGATNNYNGGGKILVFDTNLDQTAYNSVFNRLAVNNGNPDEPHDFYHYGPQHKDYTNYLGSNGPEGLLAPVPYSDFPGVANYWHYDSSTTNRHNPMSYDLWVEYSAPGKNNVFVTNGNWQQ